MDPSSKPRSHLKLEPWPAEELALRAGTVAHATVAARSPKPIGDLVGDDPNDYVPAEASRSAWIVALDVKLTSQYASPC